MKPWTPRPGVRSRGGFIQQKELRRSGESAGDLNPALIPVGQVPGELFAYL